MSLASTLFTSVIFALIAILLGFAGIIILRFLASVVMRIQSWRRQGTYVIAFRTTRESDEVHLQYMDVWVPGIQYHGKVEVRAESLGEAKRKSREEIGYTVGTPVAGRLEGCDWVRL